MTGILRREEANSLDANGDPIPGTVTNYSVQGIRDNFAAHYALLYGIPQTDVRIVLILGLIKPATMPQKDDKIFIRGEWYQVRRVLEVDPANASVTLQAFQVAAP